METVKTDCILYDEEKERCKGLNKLYCEIKQKPCNFYRSKESEEKKNANNRH